jgi:hypothetical protein
VANPKLIGLHPIKNKYPFGTHTLPQALSDEQVDSLSAQPLVPRMLSLPVTGDPENPDGKIEWMIRPSADDTVWSVENQVLHAMLQANAWQRPVYFSVTASKRDVMGLENWTTNEGLVFRLRSHPADSISLLRMSRNAFENFTYDHVDDKEVVASSEMRRLKNFYGAHLILLAQGCVQNGRQQEAQRALALLKEKKLMNTTTIVHSPQPEKDMRRPMRQPRPDWEH